jgi:hypothetical protein
MWGEAEMTLIAGSYREINTYGTSAAILDTALRRME